MAQHYAVKTIENICSQGGDWAAKFCSQDVAFSLVQVGEWGEDMVGLSASALRRAARWAYEVPGGPGACPQLQPLACVTS